jgi:alkaline phosphatase
VTAARVFKHGTNRQRLWFETLDNIGYQSTHSKNSMITDSAAAASAWACGVKFRNGEISFDGKLKRARQTILEIARAQGRGTGLVVTSSVTHATPAAFAAHVASRQRHHEIARQMVGRTRVDVILGAGQKYFRDGDKWIKPVPDNGYRVVESAEELAAVTGTGPLLGLFSPEELTPMMERGKKGKGTGEPTLADMTRKALMVLAQKEKGFFLLVEGSQIDWAGHDKNLRYLISEILAFDDAVKSVLDWIRAVPGRAECTLLIVVPDHDTGGLAVTGPRTGILNGPGHLVKKGWIGKRHTGEDTLIWSQGPYSEHLGRAIDNTDIFHIMKAALLGEPYTPPR